jgi:hypothetical protein
MDIKRIIKSFEESRRKEREAEVVKADAEHTRIWNNALKIEEQMRTIVQPVLKSARDELRACGYPAEIDVIMSTDGDFRGSKRALALQLRLRTSNEHGKKTAPPPLYSASLHYHGDYDGMGFLLEIKLSRAHKPQEARKFSLDKCTKERVEKDVEAFLRQVFPG